MSILCTMVGASFTVAATAQVLRAKKGITAVGNAQVDTAQSKFGGASALFDGTDDLLSIASTSDFSFHNKSWTIEAWVYSSWAQYDRIFDFSSAVCNIGFGNTTGQLGFYPGYGETYLLLTNNIWNNNQWNHIAVTGLYNGSTHTITMWYNGTSAATTSGITLTSTSAQAMTIGAAVGFSDDFGPGWIDEVRISDTARYTANFTPSTTPFVNDTNTLLLIHADGTDASTVFEDDNGVRARNDFRCIGNARISTTRSQFGGTSAYFDGNGDYAIGAQTISFPDDQDFTWEFWYNEDVSQNHKLIGGQLANDIFIGRDGNGFAGRLGVGIVGVGWYMDFGVTPALDTWHHVAVVRTGDVVKGYLNGELKVTHTGGLINYNWRWTNPVLGAETTGNTPFNGYLDEIRWSNTARYTGNFTPSTAPFVNDANTVCLLHCDGTNNSTVISDDNSQLTVRAAATSVNEGSSLTFNVNTVNTADQTLYYSLTNAGDFATSTGSFSLTSNAGSFSVTPTADTTTEGAETFTASVRTGSTSGTIIATSSAVTINDTSITLLARPYTVTRTGSKSVDTSQKRIGTGSLSYAPGTLDATMNMPTGDFTIEYWARVSDRSGGSGMWEIKSGVHTIYVPNGEVGGNVRNLGLVITDTSGNILLNYASPGGSLQDTTWTHVAIVRSGNNFRVFTGGTLRTTQTVSGFTMPNTTTLTIGVGGGNLFRGNIDEFRFSNTARYSSNYTPSTTAFTNDANTLLLLHMDGTNGSTSFPDDNS